jgi:long-chain acyl-CoA synthetase
MTSCYYHSVPHTGTGNSSTIKRSHRSDLIGKIAHHGCLTLYETFSRSAQHFVDRKCLGQRPVDTLNGTPGLFLFRTYAEIARSVRYTASGLVKEGLILPNSDGLLPLGIFLKNSAAWIIAENACYYLNAVVIPLYDTLGSETLEYIINQTGLQTIICSAKELEVLADVASKCPSLKAVVVADLSIPNTACTEVMKGLNVKVLSLHDLERIGEAYPTPPKPPQATDIATICYTSGTTGKVMV